MNPIRLLLVDDQDIVRAGLRSLLGGDPDMEVIGETGGGEATRRIKEIAPQVNILALTIHENEAYFFDMLNAGASGYVPKRASPNDLLAAIRVAAAGEVFLHPFVAGALVQDYLRRAQSGVELTPRQREVLTLVAEGKSNQAIADQLGISVRTVDRHRENIMKRLNLHSRTDLVKYALRKGLIQLD